LFAVFDKKPTDGQALVPQLSELLHDWIFLAGGKTKAAKFSLENAMQANKQCCNLEDIIWEVLTHTYCWTWVYIHTDKTNNVILCT